MTILTSVAQMVQLPLTGLAQGAQPHPQLRLRLQGPTA